MAEEQATSETKVASLLPLLSAIGCQTLEELAEHVAVELDMEGDVTLENEEDGAKSVYQLVGPDETDTKGGRISVESPIGKALLGRNKGDTVLVMRPKGEIELTIVAIKYV